MIAKPTKRNPHIVELSRDHHAGLLFCWKIRQGFKLNVELERIQKYINFFWEDHLKEHFREEEELLFNKVDSQVCNQGKDEHEIIRLLISGINSYSKDNIETYKQLVNLVDQHIRYEERVLFPYLEQHLSDVELEAIGKVLAVQHAVPFVDNFSDEFWVKSKA